MKRTRRAMLREAATATAALTLFGACTVLAPVEPRRIPRVGFAVTNLEPSIAREPFQQGLRELGYVEGQTIQIEWRSANGDLARFPGIATELSGLGLQAVVTNNLTMIAALRERAPAVPIVFFSLDPIAAGLFSDLAHPGGNVTGASGPGPEVAGKRVDLLKGTAPAITRVALLDAGPNATRTAAMSAAQRLGIEIVPLEVRRGEDIDAALAAAGDARADALCNEIGGGLGLTRAADIAEFALRNRMPSMHNVRALVDAGGLLFYGASQAYAARRSASYVDRIIKGAKPGDLPVEGPTKFDLVINLVTARKIGLTIPRSVLDQATEVIQ